MSDPIVQHSLIHLEFFSKQCDFKCTSDALVMKAFTSGLIYTSSSGFMSVKMSECSDSELGCVPDWIPWNQCVCLSASSAIGLVELTAGLSFVATSVDLLMRVTQFATYL